jgi:hypothetical protein
MKLKRMARVEAEALAARALARRRRLVPGYWPKIEAENLAACTVASERYTIRVSPRRRVALSLSPLAQSTPQNGVLKG